MKPTTWIIIGIIVVIAIMILLTVLPQTDLLQTRARQGIGTTNRTDLNPYQ